MISIRSARRCCSACAASRISAQDNYEIQVYGSDLVPKGATMVELHSNFTTRSGVDLGPGMFSTYHAVHETLEITHGFTDFFELGYYHFTSVQPGEGFNWVGTHLRPRFAVPEKLALAGRGVLLAGNRLPAQGVFTATPGPGNSARSSTRRSAASTGRSIRRWSSSLKGENSGQGLEFSPNVTVGIDLTHRLNLALEYYGTFGPLSGFDPVAKTEQ